MRDVELEKLRRRRFVQIRKRLLTEGKERKEKSKQELLKKVFVGRAWEVFNALKAQYPNVAGRLEEVLAQLISSGRINQLSGQELYYLLRKMGLKVRLKTRIRIKEHGKMKSIEEKMKESG